MLTDEQIEVIDRKIGEVSHEHFRVWGDGTLTIDGNFTISELTQIVQILNEPST